MPLSVGESSQVESSQIDATPCLFDQRPRIFRRRLCLTLTLMRAGALMALASLAFAIPASASPIRVSSLGGESALLLDKTNLLRYPALARTFAHADIELFDDWAGAVIPVGNASAIGLYLNHPTVATDHLNSYIATTGSQTFRSLRPTPWFEVIGATTIGSLQVGSSLRYAYDRQQQGPAKASASLREALLGMSVGAGTPHGFEATLRFGGTSFVDQDSVRKVSKTDGAGLGIDLRGRWQVSSSAFALPWVAWERDEAGLAPESRRVTRSRAGLGLNARLQPSVLVVGGIFVGIDEEEMVDAAGVTRSNRSLQLPTTLGGIEIHMGAMAIRVGIRHSARWNQDKLGDVEDESFATELASSIGLGFRFGRASIDGLLRKQILRDGPYLLTGAGDEDGGLFTNVSLTYQLYD